MARTPAERIADALAAFDRERDCWIAVARKDGTAHLVPLSFWWDGECFVIATLEQSVTVNAVKRTGHVRASLPSTADVVIIEATAKVISLDAIDAATHHRFCATAGFDPVAEPQGYVYVVLMPVRIQSWRDVAELAGRDIMIDGQWQNEAPSRQGSRAPNDE